MISSYHLAVLMLRFYTENIFILTHLFLCAGERIESNVG